MNLRTCNFFAGFVIAWNMALQVLSQSMTDPSMDLGGGEDFLEPDQLSSSNSQWNITLNVDIGTVKYNWLELKRRMYNGKIPGPAITVKPGDNVTIDLNNLLSADGNDIGRQQNEFRFPNTTNLHAHGLHISSEDPQDNVLKHVYPGASNRYIYQIHSRQPPGTYWYHAHLHGSALLQVNGGLAGMLIVADSPSEMAAELNSVSCPNNCDKDIQLLFQPLLVFGGRTGYGNVQDWILDYQGFQHDFNTTLGVTLTEWLGKNVSYFTTNGQLHPNLTMTIGQMYRFRMVNAGGDNTLELYIVNGDNYPTEDCDIREIAHDGVYLDSPKTTHVGQSFLPSGARVDWMVKCNVEGTYKVRSFANSSQTLSIGGLSRFTGDLLSLVVSGTAVSPVQNFPTVLPTRPNFVSDLRNISDSDIGGRFVVELNPRDHLNRELWKGGHNYRYKMTVGTTQEWHLLNTDNIRSHPIHMHVNHFQIISYNPYTGAYSSDADNWELVEVGNLTSSCFYQREGFQAERERRSAEGEFSMRTRRQADNPLRFLGHDVRYEEDAGNTLGYARIGEWKDVALVPPLANITIRLVAHEHTGDVMIHCHLLSHEDSGMMMIVEIVPEGQNTEANITSGNAYPGTCRECDRYPFNNATRLCDTATDNSDLSTTQASTASTSRTETNDLSTTQASTASTSRTETNDLSTTQASTASTSRTETNDLSTTQASTNSSSRTETNGLNTTQASMDSSNLNETSEFTTAAFTAASNTTESGALRRNFNALMLVSFMIIAFKSPF